MEQNDRLNNERKQKQSGANQTNTGSRRTSAYNDSIKSQRSSGNISLNKSRPSATLKSFDSNKSTRIDNNARPRVKEANPIKTSNSVNSDKTVHKDTTIAPKNEPSEKQQSKRRALSAKKKTNELISTTEIVRKIRKLIVNDDAITPYDIVRIKGGIDRPMLIIIILLLCFGSVMVFSASYAFALSKYNDSYYFIRRQLLFAVVGVGAMFFITLFDYRIIRKFTNMYFVFCIGMLALVLVMGIAAGKARRWISVGGFFTIQPSELMKLGVVLVLANYYQKKESYIYKDNFWVSSFTGTFIPLIILAIACFMIVLENHISGTIIVFLIGIVVIFVGGAKKIWLAIAGGISALGVSAVIFLTSYATKRLDMWLHPENYSAQSDIWQTLQGLYAVGSGGLFGVGLGNGRQKNLFVSMPQNDFIFSILCEELGFIGAVLVIVLFGLFVWRGYKIAMRAPDTFSRLTVIGITGKVAIQALLNIAVVTGSIPNTGISLPFFSYGGSSLLIQMAEMGIVLTISRYSTQKG